MSEEKLTLRDWYEKSGATDISYEQWIGLRRRAQTDLFFLGTKVLGKPWVEQPHREMCEHFVHKNPDLPFYEQDALKERLLMEPRGSFKSTVDIVDAVQWTICFPDVRILVLTAADDLSTAFVDEYKNYFIFPEGADPTQFQKLFPDFRVAPGREKGPEGEFVCPARTRFRKEPTIWSASILSTLPGWHCDVMKSDDVVTDKNAEESRQREKVIRKLEAATKLVDPGGYIEYIGTPSHAGDAYGRLEEESSPGELKVLRRAAWWPKPGYEGQKPQNLPPENVELLFEKDAEGTPRLSYKFLKRKSRQRDFVPQYLCIANEDDEITFPKDLLEQRTIGWEQLPKKLIYYISWDFAYSRQKKRDYSVGTVGALDEQNRLYIIDIYRERYLPDDLAFKVAESCRAYMPRLVLIENSNGAEFLVPTIRRQAEAIGLQILPLDIFKVDNKPDAKRVRISALQPLLKGGRLFFLDTVSYLEDLYREFNRYGSDSHDDIPDCVSHFQRILPLQPEAPPDPQAVALVFEKLREKELEDMLFGNGNYAPPPPPPSEPEPETPAEVVDYFSFGAN